MNKQKLTDTEITLLKLTRHKFTELQETVEDIVNDHVLMMFIKMTKENLQSKMTPETLKKLNINNTLTN